MLEEPGAEVWISVEDWLSGQKHVLWVQRRAAFNPAERTQKEASREGATCFP